MIQEFENKFKHRIDKLSTRTRFALASIKLDKFNNFYRFFIEENKMIDFQTLKNCGEKTEKELNGLMQLAIDYRSKKGDIGQNNIRYTNSHIIAFEQGFDALSVRTKNVLMGFQAGHLAGFIERVLDNEMFFKISRARNCGAKSYNEILLFRETIQRLLIVQLDPISNSSNDKELDNIQITRISQFRFQQGFDSLSVRTRNVLTELGAATIENFSNIFLTKGMLKDLLQQKNCGEKTIQEINTFKLKVIDLVSGSYSITLQKTLFKDMEVYLFEGKVLKEVELLIVRNYFGFIQNETFKSYEDISKQHELTKERVRQLSIITLKKIKEVVVRLCEKGNYDMKEYFISDNFYVTQDYAKEINDKEATNFSTSFLTFIMECIENKDYYFFCLNKKPRNYSGLFCKKITAIDLASCADYLIQYATSRRTKVIVLNIDVLIKKFQVSETGDKERLIFIDFLNSLASFYQEEEDAISVNTEAIIFEKTTKKLKSDHLTEILNFYKKPMHYTELYKEYCKIANTTSTPTSILSTLHQHPEIFGLKGPGIYGMVEWGGYFGTIGDVTEQLLRDRNKPIERNELDDILCRELYISQSSIREVLFHYEAEDRFIRFRNNTVALKEWQTKK